MTGDGRPRATPLRPTPLAHPSVDWSPRAKAWDCFLTHHRLAVFPTLVSSLPSRLNIMTADDHLRSHSSTAIDPVHLAQPPGDGFPVKPWTNVSDSAFFAWLMAIGPCRSNEIGVLLHQFLYAGGLEDMPVVVIDKLRRIRVQLQTKCERLQPTCDCIPVCDAGRDVHPLPSSVYCQLSRGPGRKVWTEFDDWKFDARIQHPPEVLGWIIARLEEFYWHRSLSYPRAEFPVQIGGPVESRFGPVPWFTDTASLNDPCFWLTAPVFDLSSTGIIIELIHNEWPADIRDLALRRKWLSYLHRQAPLEAVMMDFPPLTCSLLNITDAPGFDEDAATVLWGHYHSCEIKVTILRGWKEAGLKVPDHVKDDEPLLLRGISGFTVAFFALPGVARLKLLQMSQPREAALSDLRRHDLCWLLPTSVLLRDSA